MWLSLEQRPAHPEPVWRTARPQPVVTLIPITEDARCALGMAEISVERLPFSLGRDSRALSYLAPRMVLSTDRRRGLAPELNDIYLVEPTQPYQISREHLRIAFVQETFVLTDRGSVRGTTVNWKTVGGDRNGGYTELHDRDVIAVGNEASPFVFEFRVG